MSVKNNAKLLAMRATIAGAIKDGKLTEKMDVIRLQAGELNLSDDELQKIIDEQKNKVEKQNQISNFAQKNKLWIAIITISIVVIEWVIGALISSLTLSTVIWLLVVNVLSLVCVVIIASWFINKKY